MSTKYVSDTKAGKSISAWIILKRGKYVATVRSHYSDGGVVLVNVFQSSDAVARSWCKMTPKAPRTPEMARRAHDIYGFQRGRAGGYGYDKFTAALSGLVIDGHKMSDHCGERLQPTDGAGLFPEDFKPPKGYQLANWQGSRESDKPRGYMSCYRLEGLRYLEAIGYTVHQAI